MKRPTVHVRADKNWLRLEWTFGKRYYLYLGLEDNKANRFKSKDLQLKIEADIETGNFDETLNKYKLELTNKELADLTVASLYGRWLAYKAGEWDGETAKQRSYFLTQIDNYFGSQDARSITPQKASLFCWSLD
jgi:integrase